MTPENIDLSGVNAEAYGETYDSLSEQVEQEKVKIQGDAVNAATTADQAAQKGEQEVTGGRTTEGEANWSDGPTSKDGTRDFNQATKPENLPEGTKTGVKDEQGNFIGGKKSVGEELSGAIKGGFMDAGESTWTFFGRARDMLNGKDQGQEDYRPEGMFYDEEKNIDLNPITEQTWYGSLTRGAVGGLALIGGTVLAVKGALAIPVLAPLAGFFGAAGTATKAGRAMSFAKWMGGSGLIADTIDMKSADDNISGQIEKTEFMKSIQARYPFISSPLATRDTDSIMTKTFKNVLELGGMSGVLGSLYGYMVKPGAKQAAKVGKGNAKLTAAEMSAQEKVLKKATAQAEELQRAAADAELTENAAKKYNKVGKKVGRQDAFFDQLTPEQQDQLKLELYNENPKKYEGWSPVNDTPEDKALRDIVEMNYDENDQIAKAGVEQLEIPGFGEFKNKGTLTDAQQGNVISTNRVGKVAQQVSQTRNSYMGEYGSTDAILTPAQISRALKEGVEGKELQQVLDKMMKQERYGDVIKGLQGEGVNVRQIFKESFLEAYNMVQGVDLANTSVEEFWKKLDDAVTFRTGGPLSKEAWYMKNVVVADFVNASLFKNMRDMGLAAREIKGVLDPWDKGGPAQQILDKLEYGLYNVKRSRMLISNEFRSLQTPEGVARSTDALNKKLFGIKEEAKNTTKLMRELAMRSPSNELSETMLEVFSMSNDIRNWEDISEVFRRMLKGGEYKGVRFNSMLLKELQGTMIHSVLSGPKTPIRAIMGTATATFLKPIAQTIGGLATFDKTIVNESLSELSGAVGAIPDAFKLFRRNLNSYWTGEMSTVKSRYYNETANDMQWKAMGEVIMKGDNIGDKAAYLLGNFAREINSSSLLTYSTKIMSATDDAFGYVMARSQAKKLAMRDSLEAQGLGNLPEITPALMKDFEDRYMAKFVNPKTGLVQFDQSAALKHMQEEATLTRELTGWSKSFASLFETNPWTKPFFLFARTGINGIRLSTSHMPLFNFLVEENRAIFNASEMMADNAELLKYGIENAQDLRNAKALLNGRMAIGGAVITAASMQVMSGNLTGNYSPDIGVRNAQRAGNWQPRSIRIFGKWVSYDSFEPFNTVLAYVADVAGAQELMGQQWTEDKLQKVSVAIMSAGFTKSYLSGLSQIIDLVAGDPGTLNIMAANLANNTLPLGGLRNEVGKVINPYMKELNRELDDQVRNRNQTSELLAGEPLPIKYDLLNGKKINDWDLPTRLFNMFSPVKINPDWSPGRALLFESKYDLALIATKPNGIDLSKHPKLRSEYQRLMGKENVEAKLNNLAQDPKIKQSLEDMKNDRRDPNREGTEPQLYEVNQRIQVIMEEASGKAIRMLMRNPEMKRLMQEKQLLDASNRSLQTGQRRAYEIRRQQLQELRNLSGVN